VALCKKTARELYNEAEQAAKNRIAEGKPLRLSPAAKVENDEATVYIYDAIGGWFGIQPSEFISELNGLKAKTIHLRINSPGGSVFDAEAIQTALQQHPAKIIAHVDGWAASAASYVAMAGNEIEMADGAFFMIHNAWVIAMGNAADLMDVAAFLEKIDQNIVSDYERKTGKSRAQIEEWMKAETFFNAAEALEHGFIDRIYAPDDSKNSAVTRALNSVRSETERARMLRLCGAC
jgi:ATP-dependent Clp protease protease subunit